MGQEYLRGNPVSIVERFWRIDEATRDGVPADPTVVTFTLLAPDGSEQSFVWPGAPEVERPDVGVFVLTVPPPALPGEWRGRAEGSGSGSLIQAREFSFTVLESSVLVPVDSSVARQGPCSSWISGVDVVAFDPSLGVGMAAAYEYDDVAAAASALMFELSGRQFPGVCETVVRPCRQACACWGGGAAGVGPFYWSSADVAGALQGGWVSERGDACGCGHESSVALSGYPVREVLEVLIDGEVVDPSGYRLDDRRRLVRLADLSTSPPTDRSWPACQDLGLPDSEPGTFSVRYSFGVEVPLLGRWAAAQLAAELWKAFPGNQGECHLPSRVTRIARNGVTMERILPTADLLRQGATGLQMVDSFVAQVNPTKARRRSAVFSPDVPRFGRHVGQ